ncbi:MAG: hypothetical protein LBC73_03745, partial [Oscillospiraceae bacterium]|nr:hypothetical protein [Oscillospiraceae bacterium]
MTDTYIEEAKLVKWIENKITPAKKDQGQYMALMDVETIKKIQKFHQTFPQYNETPLVSLKNLAKKLEVGGIYVKDESYRFGLNSFKALGCTYAIAAYIAQKLGKSVWELDYNTLPKAA